MNPPTFRGMGKAAPILVALVGGCHLPTARLNAPPQGEAPARTSSIAPFYAYMTDQALMQDRSIGDLHFVAGTTELSGAGCARLARYAELLATRGGTIYYDTTISDPDLVGARVQTAKRYLAEAVPSAAEIEVAVGLSRGRGMDSKEALARRKTMLEPPEKLQVGAQAGTAAGAGASGS